MEQIMIEVFPVKFEGYDTTLETPLLVFTIEGFDEGSATIKMETVVTLEAWDELSKAVNQALIDMKLSYSEK